MTESKTSVSEELPIVMVPFNSDSSNSLKTLQFPSQLLETASSTELSQLPPQLIGIIATYLSLPHLVSDYDIRSKASDGSWDQVYYAQVTARGYEGMNVILTRHQPEDIRVSCYSSF